MFTKSISSVKEALKQDQSLELVCDTYVNDVNLSLAAEQSVRGLLLAGMIVKAKCLNHSAKFSNEIVVLFTLCRSRLC